MVTSQIAKIYFFKGSAINEFFERKIQDESIIEKMDLITVSPCDINGLPNGYLLSANYYQHNLTLYNKNFNLVKTVTQINKRSISCAYITNDNKSRIYISNYNQCHFIMMTDLELNHIKTLETDYWPLGICFHNGIVLVCDFKGSYIHKLTAELEFIQKVKLDFVPWTVKALNKTVVINSHHDNGIYFYDLDTFNLKNRYNHGFCQIFVLGSVFYEYSKNLKKIFCYDDESSLLREFNVKYFNDYHHSGSDCSTTLFNDFIVISLHSNNHILKIYVNN